MRLTPGAESTQLQSIRPICVLLVPSQLLSSPLDAPEQIRSYVNDPASQVSRPVSQPAASPNTCCALRLMCCATLRRTWVQAALIELCSKPVQQPVIAPSGSSGILNSVRGQEDRSRPMQEVDSPVIKEAVMKAEASRQVQLHNQRG
jgi:hypothetical protein